MGKIGQRTKNTQQTGRVKGPLGVGRVEQSAGVNPLTRRSIPGAYTGGGGGGGGSPLPMNPPRSFKFRFNMFKNFACALTACEHVFAIDHGRVSSHAHATFIQLSRI